MGNIVNTLLSTAISLFSHVGTYSFLDLTGVISHPSLGSFTLTGKGVGEITISMANDKTSHEIGIDGAILATQVPGNNGTLILSIQQTSALNNWLLKWANYLQNEQTPRNEWLMTTILIKSKSLKIEHKIAGVSPQKIPDSQYQAQGQRVTWVLMAADIQTT
ncbi:hypothetical protein SOV_04770 [Sporomusa ovata DSM 2662]|nr:phage protein [Sporomusa ovata]EQB28147.1 hypothetical protein SOV_2c10700 [Sporomusa ovata DSM 2662]